MVGAYLASLAETHAPSTIRRRLAALGKMHRFNDLPWNPAHRDIQEPLRGLLRQHGRPAQKAAALTLAMLRQLLATCDTHGARPARPGPAAVRLRRRTAPLRTGGAAGRGRGGRRRRAARCGSRGARPTRRGRGPRSACRGANMLETCPVRAFEAWQAVAKRKAGPLFRRISTGRPVSAMPRCTPMRCAGFCARRIGMAGLTIEGFERMSAHALRVGFITEAYGKGVRDEDIMRHTRHRDLRTMRGYVQRAGLLTESPAGLLDL